MGDAPTYPPKKGKPFCVIRTEEFKQQYGGHGGSYYLINVPILFVLYCFYMVNAPLHYSHYWKDADSRWPAKRYWL